MKSKLTLISTAAAVVQLASCNGNPLEDIDYNDPVFHALTETESGTKTMLGKEDNAGNVPIMWSSGDEIIVTGDSREKACSYYKTADKNTSAAEFRYDRSKTGTGGLSRKTNGMPSIRHPHIHSPEKNISWNCPRSRHIHLTT